MKFLALRKLGWSKVVLFFFSVIFIGSQIAKSDSRSNLTQAISAEALAMAQDTIGNIYVAGIGFRQNVTNWVIRKSTQGSQFETVNEFSLTKGEQSVPSGIAVDTSGNVYVVGMGADASHEVHWLVRKSSDGGLTWVTVRDLNYSADFDFSMANAIEVNSLGEIFVVGTVGPFGRRHWWVEKSVDAGVTWKTAGDYNFIAGHEAEANGVAIDRTGNIYVAGRAYDREQVFHWIVRKSADSGTTWTTIQDFVYGYESTRGKPERCSRCYDSVANSVALDSTGNIYVAGSGVDGFGKDHWIIRKSKNGGSQWDQISDFHFVPKGEAEAFDMKIDPTGAIYVIGFGNGEIGGHLGGHWLVRKSSDGGTTWETIDDFSYDFGNWSIGKALLVDKRGHFYATGFGLDSNNLSHWLMRKSKDGGTSWKSIDDFVLE